MMEEGDPRVKELQQMAWGLQSFCAKPGGRLPEDYKNKCHKFTSKALALCSNAAYMEQSDFVGRAEEFKKQIERTRKEAEEVEEDHKKAWKAKCFVAKGEGGYTVSKRADSYFVDGTGGMPQPEKTNVQRAIEEATATLEAERPAHETPSVVPLPGDEPWPTCAGQLSAKEVAARCAEDPEALWLSGLGVTDSDIEAVNIGILRGGSSLTALDLSHNAIGDAGIQRLATAFAKGACPKLKDLWLGGNEFGEMGSQILTSGLSALRRDLTIHVGENVVPRPTDSAAQAVPQQQSEVGETLDESTDSGQRRGEDLADARGKSLGAGESAKSGNGVAQLQIDEPKKEGSVRVEVLPAVVGEDAPKTPSVVRATVPLPENASSPQDLDLNVSRMRIQVRSSCEEGRVLADIALPCAVDPDSSQAVFSRKKRTVTVTLKAEV
eukprot:TRINITY_DN17901_c0_g1_i1.p1 TRINITY_DN17901_c0_g1~~TRINITY_DN17901_c0_g1_i1.p1  ORF type:complete len:437 (+),score=86.43 TRINITY_DN17901_c0_g1_i1:91-1401(+)